MGSKYNKHKKIKEKEEEAIPKVNTFFFHFSYDNYQFDNIKVVMTEKKESIQSLISLKDKRIAICTEWGQIKIFNPSNKYICDIEIAEAHSKVITSLCEIDNGHLVSCSNDSSIKIWKIYIQNTL